ncbi:MAG: NUMOD3 domain-containing DNA-binding protein [Nanoarchaeota archaeon]
MPFQKGHKESQEVKEKRIKSLKGRIRSPFSEEWKMNIRKARKGKKLSEETKKKISISLIGKNLGKKASEETKRKLSKSHKGKHNSPNTEFKKGQPGLKGKDSPSWKGGVSPVEKIIRGSIEYRLWRESVFARDNWTCQKCKIKGSCLHPHHIRNFAEAVELRFAIDNGITLCKKCHQEFHKKYSNYNNNLNQVKEFINK